jgi:hypothetical protein
MKIASASTPPFLRSGCSLLARDLARSQARVHEPIGDPEQRPSPLRPQGRRARSKDVFDERGKRGHSRRGREDDGTAHVLSFFAVSLVVGYANFEFTGSDYRI